MQKKLFLFLQYCTPHHTISRLIGLLAQCRIRWVKNPFIRWFIKHYHVDMLLAENENIDNYLHFNDFFTRRLKPNARPIDQNPRVLLSPADGTLSEFGNIDQGTLLQAKGQSYSLIQLIGNSQESVPFQNGKFITIYLSPRDYHRVHMPASGKLLKTIYIPGKLFSVNQISAENIPHLFARNERMVSLFKTEQGKIAVIMVGAMIVAGIRTIWSDPVTSNCHRSIQTQSYENIELVRGAEMGAFYLGSTVIVLFEQTFSWNPSLSQGRPIHMGSSIGYV